MDVYLKNSGYQWTKDEQISFKGFFCLNEVFYSESDAINCLLEELKNTDISILLPRLNGNFCFVLETEKQIICAVDRLRSMPLFYAKSKNKIQVGDDVELLVQNMSLCSISEFSEKEFVASSLFVTGNKTLLEGLYQVEAGTCCVFDKDTLEVRVLPYFQTEHQEFIRDTDELERKFWKAYNTTAKHLVRALNGRTAVIPLSGGADSRMVLRMLKMENYQNVICFTYGKKGNRESDISRTVAKEYGYPWVMVPYTKEMWTELRQKDIFRCYKEQASSYVSTPHYQDFPAVKYLVEHNMIPKDGVFVPGHSGDLIAGSHITPEFLNKRLSREEFLNAVYMKFFPTGLSLDMKKKIEDRFLVCNADEVEKMASQIEWFNIQERQAKFIVNSVRVYEFFGHEWLIPLWDNEMFEFWKHVPIELRYQRKLYFSVVKEKSPSTNDNSMIKSIASMARNVPGVRGMLRKGKRILNWWKSSLWVERSFSFIEYMRACLRGNQFFTINTLVNQKMLLEWKDKIKDEKE